jgi:thiol-disulfide isomerase/thioredoxin
MKRLLGTLLLLGMALPSLAQETLVTGTLVGHDGEAMPAAHVSLYEVDERGEALHTVEADPEGRYRVTVDTTGVFTLWYTGAHHLVEEVSLLAIETPDTVEIDVRLSTHAYRDDLSELQVVGDFNDFSFRSGAVAMTPQDNGTYAVTVPADDDSLAYQVLNAIEDARSINGTMSDRLVYDGGGDYRSVVAAPGDSVRLVFDPAAVVEGEQDAQVAFGDTISAFARYAAFSEELGALRQSFIDGFMKLRQEEASQDEMKTYQEAFDWSPAHEAIAAYLDQAATAEESHVALLTYLSLVMDPEPVYGKRALAEIDPTSPLWTIRDGRVMGSVLRATEEPEAYTDLLRTMLREHPSEDVRPTILLTLIQQARRAENDEQLELLYAWLSAEYPESLEARLAAARYAPDRPVRKGNAVPSFEVTALEDSTVTYSDASLRGKTVLLDFWATWCGPCIAELPDLHEAYATYRDDGFTILSLSFDGSPQEVVAFREDEWAMPWLHAFLEGGFRSDVAQAFDVIGIPKPVLVGPDGTILATGSDLRGDSLAETLADVLGAPEDEATDEAADDQEP